ncbi:hypothetical protein HY991_05365, partial [Candidatus Micrarchaeota archaeon]|nr:hypothetical protein [Candidatus Micrarchaeota archaeon]
MLDLTPVFPFPFIKEQEIVEREWFKELRDRNPNAVVIEFRPVTFHFLSRELKELELRKFQVSVKGRNPKFKGPFVGRELVRGHFVIEIPLVLGPLPPRLEGRKKKFLRRLRRLGSKKKYKQLVNSIRFTERQV